MEIVYKQDWNGVQLLVDGEDTETMSIKKREWVLNAVMEQIDNRHFETVLTALAKKHGDMEFISWNNGIKWELNLENKK
jgi:hypothetical protein